MASKKKLKTFTLIEIVVAIVLVSILTAVTLTIINPSQKVDESKQKEAIIELREIAKAVQYYASDLGAYPADVSRGLPSGIEDYLRADGSWPDGPLPGSVYDYDNWSEQTCIDPNASGSIQVTLRQVPDRNPDGSDVWAWYFVLSGNGTPHCNSATEWDLGECVSCPDFEL